MCVWVADELDFTLACCVRFGTCWVWFWGLLCTVGCGLNFVMLKCNVFVCTVIFCCVWGTVCLYLLFLCVLICLGLWCGRLSFVVGVVLRCSNCFVRWRIVDAVFGYFFT